ncbi:MAG TPA: cytochrome c3 family protein [Terriglobales bacterium]|nr:cytochrome c3 family protein [Terriglobales bacterium]
MKKFFLLSILVLVLGSGLRAQFTGDVLGSHNLSPSGTSPVKGASSAACLYCHAPHSGIGGSTPLWSQTLSSQTYNMYSSTTMQNTAAQPTVGGPSSLCLSCHDGTVAVGSEVPYGTMPVSGTMYSSDVFGTNLKASHPFILNKPLVDSPTLVPSLAATGTTADPLHKVALIGGTVECTSCHEPHQQNLDPVSLNFLVRDGSSGQLCLACHSPDARTVKGKTNPLAQWSTSIHAMSANNVAGAAKLGSYTTVAQFACLSCHMPHNANGAAGLLRGTINPPPNTDATSMSCVTCHNGSANLQQPIANVYAELAKTTGHPMPVGSNTHDANEPAVLVNNRHTTCADCHNGHSSSQVLNFPSPPTLRVSQTGVVGVSATDGTTVINPAVNQYENCLRCHGSSPGKQAPVAYGYLPVWAVSAADPLNVIPQFAATATSSHPVLHTSTSPWLQPSLLNYILNIDGVSPSSRSLASSQPTSIFCSDCHNADDNREFGGQGPNGPHGSQYSHILERRYEFSQVSPAAGPGTPIQNLYVTPNLNAGGGNPGPYALCGKCHNLSNVLSDASFKPGSTGKGGHFTHISEQGASSSVCHTAHGMGSLSGNITGERLVNFDVKVVAPNGSSPISYNHATNTCTLTCHGYYHNTDGSVSAIPRASTTVRTGPTLKTK